MHLPNFNQIKWRLSLVILGTSIVVLSLGAVAVWIYDTLNAKHNLVAQIASIAEVTAAYSSRICAKFKTRSMRSRPVGRLMARTSFFAMGGCWVRLIALGQRIIHRRGSHWLKIIRLKPNGWCYGA
jgi:hypothetical protein